jgi:hypothetical protein
MSSWRRAPARRCRTEQNGPGHGTMEVPLPFAGREPGATFDPINAFRGNYQITTTITTPASTPHNPSPPQPPPEPALGR